MRLVLAVIALAVVAGCGPIQSTASLIDADVEVEAARAAGAAASSTYEFTAAEAIRPPMTEPAIPSRVVMTKPMLCLPGMTARAISPTTNPKTIQAMIPMALSLCGEGRSGVSAGARL